MCNKLNSIIKILETFYIETDDGKVIGKNAYVKLLSKLPPEIVYKLKLAPVVGLEARLRHLIALYLASRSGSVSHIEGVGAYYNVYSSDICIDNVEIDFTSDKSLIDEKRLNLSKHFDNYDVRVIQNPIPLLDFKLAETNYYDMYKNIIFNESLLGSMDLIMAKFMDKINNCYNNLKIASKKYSEQMINYDNNEGLITWSEISQEKCIITEILSSFAPEFKNRATEVSSAKIGEFSCPLLDALKFGESIMDSSEAYYVRLGNEIEGNTYIKTSMSIFNSPFSIVENFDLAVGYSKYKGCLRAIFSSKFRNYQEVNARINLRKSSNKIERTIKEVKTKYNTVSLLMKDYNSIIDDLSGIPSNLSTRGSYEIAMKRVLDDTVSSYIETNKETVESTEAFQVANHLAEISASVIATQKFRARPNEYRLCKNGTLMSYSLVQMTGTNDSFETANFITIYVPSKLSTWLDAQEELVVTPFRTMSRNRATWFSQMPEKLINLCLVISEDNNYEITNRDIAQLFLFLYQNNNNFSSLCEQTRYLFVSATSKKEVITGIFKKKISPLLHHKNIFQAVHLLKILKMAEVITSHASTGNLEMIMSPFNIYMPAIDAPMKSFQGCINASYLYTAFNKFSTFKLGRASKVFNDLLDEKDIYDKTKVTIESELNKLRYKKTEDIIRWLTDDEEIIVSEMLKAMEDGPKRFTFNAFMLLQLMRITENSIETHINIRESLIKSPIDACTMRGGMSEFKKGKGLSCRAAETIIEGISTNARMPIQDMNNVSIYTLKCQEMVNDLEYKNRVVDKDQTGNRDISILNYAYRIGAMFCETITKSMAKTIEESVLNDPMKSKKFNEVMLAYDPTTELLDTNDQSRWGPNALMEIFYLFYSKKISDEVTSRMFAHTLEKISKKKMRVPDNVINFLSTSKSVKEGTEVDKLAKRLSGKEFITFEFSMGQGILHQTSDLFHVFSNRVLKNITSKFNLFKIKETLITSDDCFRKIELNGRYTDWRKIEWFISGVMGMMNIIRNPTKSFLSVHIGEFNSEFYNNKLLVVPTIKKCISEIDCGSGESIISDFLSAAAKGTTSLADGATIVISDSVAVASLSLTINQWNYYTPMNENKVLKGGYPLISSIVALISGSVGVLALTDDEEDVKNSFSMYYSTPEEFVQYSDTLRLTSANDNEKMRKISVLRKKGLIDGKVIISRDITGIANLTTYKKKATKFTMLVRKIKGDEVYLNRYDSTGKGFLFNFKIQFSKLSYIGDNHDFFKRYSDPSRSFEAKCFRTKSGNMLSRKELYDYMQDLEFPSVDAPVAINSLIQDAISRSIEMSSKILNTGTDFTTDNSAKRVYENNVRIDNISELSKDDLMEKTFNSLDGLDISRYMTARSLTNALYGTAPTHIKVKLYTPRKILVSKAINSIIINRTAVNITKENPGISVKTGNRAMSTLAIEAKETKDILEKVAMNYCLNPELRIELIYNDKAMMQAIIVEETLTKTNRLEMEKSASNKKLAYLPIESIKSLMQNKLLTQTVFKSGTRMVKLWYPKSDSKYAVVTNKSVENNKWCHYIFGDTTDEEIMYDWKGKRIPEDECFFIAVENTSIVKMSKDCPMMFVTIRNIEIPIMWVAPKLFINEKEIRESFPIIGELREEVVDLPYGLDSADIIQDIINDKEVDDIKLINLLTSDPSHEIVNKCLRVLGQNLYTSRTIEVENVENTVINTEPVDICKLIEEIDFSEIVNLDGGTEEVNKAVEITRTRAANSLGFTIARWIKSTSLKLRISLIKELRKAFTAKLIGCAIILAINWR